MKEKLTCFLIDDDTDDHEIFDMALKQVNQSFSCITADNGIDAFAKLDADKTFIPDFIFLDLNMPRMSGKEFLTMIKKNPRLNHIPVIMFSTSGMPEDIDETRALGAVDFLIKPPSIDILEKNLFAIFDKQN